MVALAQSQTPLATRKARSGVRFPKGCVESTMRTGYENGYRVFTLKDCVAATSQAEHDNAITYDFPMFSMPVSAETVIETTSRGFRGQFNGGRRDQRERTIPLCVCPMHLDYRAAGCANEFQTFGRKPPLKFLGVGACRHG
jgi:hypothetical protein